MDKPILYIDCDGVIFNTIAVGYEMMKKKGCNMNNHREVDKYFRELDWRDIFKEAKVINNAFERIEELKRSNLFSDVVILTGLSGSYYEEGMKRDIFHMYLPGTRVITAQRGIPKALVAPHHENSILVDDEEKNCDSYKKYDGHAILFSEDILDLDNDAINDLGYVSETNEYKELVKTRNF